MNTDVILEGLNPRQEEAVLHTEGPLLVLAGAGSGKTRVITRRIAYLIGHCGVPPWNILAVTFTNKAAGEMKRRVADLLGQADISPALSTPAASGSTELTTGFDKPVLSKVEGLRTSGWGVEGVWVGTFHSTCVRILRKHGSALGLKSSFVIYDEGDQMSLMRDCLRGLGLSERAVNPRAVLSRISRAKNELLSAEEYALQANDHMEERTAKLYIMYQERLEGLQALDFDDLLMATVRLFEEHQEVLAAYQDLWRYILVDEYQDTNHVQYCLIHLLAGKYGHLCVVGDDDQSIYRWRGADLNNILNFERDHPGCAVIRLEQNYRSTQRILQGAGAVVAHNSDRKGKTLWTENEVGDIITLYRALDETDEALFAARTIQGRMADTVTRYDDYAIFYRTNAQSRVLEEALRRVLIPYVIVGGLRFYERKEIKDLLAYLRWVVNPADSISFKRLVNAPARGIGPATIAKLELLAMQGKSTIWEACQRAVREKLFNTRQQSAMEGLLQLIEEARTKSAFISIPDLIAELITASGYAEELQRDDTPEAQSRLENLKELVTAAQEFVERNAEGGLPAFLDSVALISDIDAYTEGRGAVTLMTLHTAKGLEFDTVFMVGLEEGIFPHAFAMPDERELEEERRLCYVGMTRAKQRLYLASARQRRLYGNRSFNLPSRFLDEIPPEVLQIQEPWESRGASPLIFSEHREHQQERHEDEPFVDRLYPGARIRHPDFGVGVIRQRSGSGDDLKVVVKFNGAGEKKLMVKYAQLEQA
ncbi:UvrD-helicase domain-containing protein [Candidatus Methylomirabilis sp.]|uniref:ATP-dependent helicase n=1 Tax=Candidatus Methylomirabilis sp. TaxID=2032687 RepID=UPI002A695CEF|nr:UvrD-helicase domain-containing protein [Candidatus Methylomirabilis sp.]